jgi:hypothetical protein
MWPDLRLRRARFLDRIASRRSREAWSLGRRRSRTCDQAVQPGPARHGTVTPMARGDSNIIRIAGYVLVALLMLAPVAENICALEIPTVCGRCSGS